jgi:hypothetical protein
MDGMRTLSLALAIGVASWLSTRAARACTAPTCTRAVVFPAGGNVPADRLRLLYYPSGSVPPEVTDQANAVLPRMYRLEGATKVNVPYDTALAGSLGLWLTPTTEQPLGTQLVLETDPTSCPGDAALSATYSITEKRPTLPATLGTLTATTNRAQIPIAVDTGACSELADVAYADLRIELSEEALPFAALWRYQLYVDDRVHGSFIDSASASYRLPQGLDRIYAQCDGLDAGINGTTAIAPGVHVVHLAAQLGDERPLVTPDVQVELRCNDSPPQEPIDSGIDEPRANVNGSCALGGSHDASWLGTLLALLSRRRRKAKS